MATVAHEDLQEARERLALGGSLMEAAAELGCTRAELDLALWKNACREPEAPAAAEPRRRAWSPRRSRSQQEDLDERRALASPRRDWRR